MMMRVSERSGNCASTGQGIPFTVGRAPSRAGARISAKTRLLTARLRLARVAMKSELFSPAASLLGKFQVSLQLTG